MHSAKPSMIVPSALLEEDDDVLANKLTIASCKTLCIPKNKNMANDRMIICCVGCNVSRKAEPKPASDLVVVDDFFLVSSSTTTSMVSAADGESSASEAEEVVSPLMRGCLIVVSSSSSCKDDEPSSMSRSCSIRGDIFLHILLQIYVYGKPASQSMQIMLLPSVVTEFLEGRKMEGPSQFAVAACG